MKFEKKLIQTTIIKRYKRFLVDVIFDENHLDKKINEPVTIYTANTGSMKTCLEPNWKCAISYHDSPTRKLKYSLELTNNNESWIGVNTHLANKLTHEAIENKVINEVANFENIRSEFKIGDSRIDFLLYDGESIKSATNKCFLEVKSVSMKAEDGYAIFPDSVSVRGQKHLRELIKIVKNGDRAIILFVIQRQDVTIFRPAHEIDIDYANLLKEAIASGVEALAYQCTVNLDEITIKNKIEINHSLF